MKTNTLIGKSMEPASPPSADGGPQGARSDFVRKTAETFATRLVLMGLGLVTSVIVARILGPQGQGQYALAAAIGGIGVQIGNLGLHSANIYFVARDRGRLPSLIGNSLLVSLLAGVLGAGAGWVIFYLRPEVLPVRGTLLILALAWIPLGLGYLLLQNLLLGLQEVRAYNRIELMNKIAALGIIGGVIFWGQARVEWIFLAVLLALAFAFLWTLIRMAGDLPERPHPSQSLFKKTLPYGIKTYLAALFSFLVLRIDLLMVENLLDAEQAGYYSIASLMADMLLALPVIAGTLLFSKASAMTDPADQWRFTKRTALGIAGIQLALAGLAALLAEPVVRILFSDTFLPAVEAFVWLLPGIVLLSVNTIFMNYFASVGLPPVILLFPGVAVLLNILLNLKWIPAHGIIGASMASVAAYGFMLAGSMFFLVTRRKPENEI